jgi:hypothetical protein
MLTINAAIMFSWLGLLHQAVFVSLLAGPIWLMARGLGADHPTLGRAVFALLLGAVGTYASLFLGGNWVWLLAPLAFLLAFKSVLGAAVPGAMALAMLALAGHVLLGWGLGGFKFEPAALASLLPAMAAVA